MQYVGVSVSTLVSLAVAPVALTVAGAVAARARPALTSLATVTCALGGLALISLAPGSSGSSAIGAHPAWGIVASLGSGLGYAGTTVLNRRMAADGEPLLLTAATSGIGALVLLPIALAVGMAVPADAITDGWLVYIGIVSTVVAYGLFYAGLRSVSSEVAGVLTLLEPLTATVLAAAFLGETLSVAGLCGAALLLIAIAVLYVRRPEAEPAAL
ncbi:MAG: DMT family transporter [Actinomycetota bacterium]|nr:DMT family transporter [Actinomycetota bacterium]